MEKEKAIDDEFQFSSVSNIIAITKAKRKIKTKLSSFFYVLCIDAYITITLYIIEASYESITSKGKAIFSRGFISFQQPMLFVSCGKTVIRNIYIPV